MQAAAGVATPIIGIVTYQSLEQTRASYYASNNFADIFASLARAPRSLLNELGAIDGVLEVDGRIVRLAPADIEASNSQHRCCSFRCPRALRQ